MIYDEMYAIFMAGRDEHFEDGRRSQFAAQLIELINRHGEAAFDVLTALIASMKVDTEVISEALRWIGRIEERQFYDKRRWLLEYALGNPSAKVRDGSILGLGAMDDPHALPFVKKAHASEKNTLLRQNMQLLIDQLGETLLE